MSRPRLIVLKFGGSVLLNEANLANAVHEIYRWRRAGWRVVAVVSALAGRTNELLNQTADFCSDPCPFTVAAHVANGEFECATKLGLYLDRAGIPATVFQPSAVSLVGTGAPLDASATSVCVETLDRALASQGVVVLPGFVATDRESRTVVLGRGGSDLTALFLAAELKADCCRLIKDVDGLYEFNPAQCRNEPNAIRPRRFAHATWDDALATDGSIVQHKAVRYARDNARTFELGCLNAGSPTHIGPDRTHLVESSSASRPLRVVLLGLGTVGAGVYEHLQRLDDRFTVTAIAVHDPEKPRDSLVSPDLLTDDAVAAAGLPDADIVVELIGGTTTARRAIETALARGAHVVTANKALLARHGARLRAAARAHACQLRFAAAVGGSVPLLERLAGSRANPPTRIRAVLNGTCNFVLNRLSAGDTFAEAVALAQDRGLAESDPERDLSGLDAAEKIVLLAHAIGFQSCSVDGVARDPISDDTADRIRAAAQNGRALRHIAMFDRDGGQVTLSVRLTEVSPGDPLFSLPAEGNAAEIQWSDGTIEVLRGRGAGRWPTAEAILGDLLSLSRSPACANSPGVSRERRKAKLARA